MFRLSFIICKKKEKACPIFQYNRREKCLTNINFLIRKSYEKGQKEKKKKKKMRLPRTQSQPSQETISILPNGLKQYTFLEQLIIKDNVIGSL